jgi:hypothetical protein
LKSQSEEEQNGGKIANSNFSARVNSYRPKVCPDLLHKGDTSYFHKSLNGSGLIAEYRTVFVINEWPDNVAAWACPTSFGPRFGVALAAPALLAGCDLTVAGRNRGGLSGRSMLPASSQPSVTASTATRSLIRAGSISEKFV